MNNSKEMIELLQSNNRDFQAIDNLNENSKDNSEENSNENESGELLELKGADITTMNINSQNIILFLIT